MVRLLPHAIMLVLHLVVSGTVFAGQCNITTTPLSFGIYDTLDPVPVTTTASLAISCKNPPKIAATVSVQLSSGNSGNFTQRNMSSPSGSQLLYNVYTDATLSTIFGDGSAGTAGSPIRTIDKFTPWTLTIYAQITPLQNVPTGVYADTLTATILW